MQSSFLMLLNFAALLAVFILFGLVAICGNRRHPSSPWSVFEEVVDSTAYAALLFVSSAIALASWYSGGVNLTMLTAPIAHFGAETPISTALVTIGWLMTMSVSACLVLATLPRLLRSGFRALA